MTIDFDYDQITLQKWSVDGPTCLDSAVNYAGEDKSEFYVAPVGINRDTQYVLTLCNWKIQCDQLDEYVKHEESGITRFGHWGCGWYELYLIHESDTEALVKAQEIADDLEQYPVLDEDKYSEMEYEAQYEEYQRYYFEETMKKIVSSVEEVIDFEENADEIFEYMYKRTGKIYEYYTDADEFVEDAIDVIACHQKVDTDEYVYQIFRDMNPEWTDGDEGVYVCNFERIKVNQEIISLVKGVLLTDKGIGTLLPNKDQLALEVA